MSGRKKREDVVEEPNVDDRVIEVNLENEHFNDDGRDLEVDRFDDDGGVVQDPSPPSAPSSSQVVAAENQARLARGETDLLEAPPDPEPKPTPDMQPGPGHE